jgi:hypothetical protein
MASSVADTDERRSSWRRLCGHVAAQVGTVTGRPLYPDHIHDEIFALGIIICALQGANRNASMNPSARSSTARSLSWRPNPITVPSRSAFRRPDRADSRQLFSNFYLTTS